MKIKSKGNIQGLMIVDNRVARTRKEYLTMEDLINDIRYRMLPASADDDKRAIKESLLDTGAYGNLYLIKQEAIDTLEKEIDGLQREITLRNKVMAYISSKMDK